MRNYARDQKTKVLEHAWVKEDAAQGIYGNRIFDKTLEKGEIGENARKTGVL